MHVLPKQAGEVEPDASPVDLSRIERAVREILLAIGEDPERDGLFDTPARVARAYAELTSGLHDDPGDALGRVFEEQTEGLVLVRGIEFYSLCEHHLLPFIGQAHIAYLPADGKVVGLSKLARTVDTFARRPQVQERLTNQIADALAEHLRPRGVAVWLDGEHLCMKMRGVQKRDASMTSVAYRGELATNAALRAEATALAFRGR
jgi:GTP cyclohydrolase I